MADRSAEAAPTAEPAADLAEPAPESTEDAFDELGLAGLRRGLGTLTARVPGTTTVIGGVRLVAHRVRAVVQDGFARTEIEEEFLNETSQILEGRYVFPVPARATVTRLGLWVGPELIEGELLERVRASRIFRGIVEDTVRPRDPALLEWVRGAELSLTIFPIPAKGARKIVLAYDEVLDEKDGSTRYVYPLSLGSERAVPVGNLQISVRVAGSPVDPRPVTVSGWDARVWTSGGRTTVEHAATDVTPDRDFVVEIAPPSQPIAEIVTFTQAPPEGAAAGKTFFAARVQIPEPEGDAQRVMGDRVVVLDTSDSQTPATVAAATRLARAVVRSLEPGERFAVLACDTACESFPARELADVGAGPEDLEAFLAGLEPRGASDLAGAIATAIGRLPEANGQVIVLHDGKASAGELATDRILDRLGPLVGATEIDLRLVGVGRTVDEVTLGGIARALDASYAPLAGTGSLRKRIGALTEALARPVIRGGRVELPSGFRDVVPSELPALHPGEPLVLFGTIEGAPSSLAVRAKVSGRLGDEVVHASVPLVTRRDALPNPLLPKLWADGAIAAWEAEGGEQAREAIVALSLEHHVLSRYTSFLVLESEQMFAEFGVKRTTRRPGDQSDCGFGGEFGVAQVDDGLPTPQGALGVGSPLPEATQGAGQGRLAGSHRTSPAQIRMGMTTVTGRLPAETVRRIVRMSMGRFRACYERGLERNPRLAGRVATRFVIDRTGRVSVTADAGSDLPDAEIVACVNRGFRFLDFPQPEGGIVTVIYPIVFSSDGSRPDRPATLWPERLPAPRAYLPPPVETAAERRRTVERWRPRATYEVAHFPGEESWREARRAEIDRLADAVRSAPTSRIKRDQWLRALLLQGHFAEARTQAGRFVELDPDLALARELLAQSAAALGETPTALGEVAALAELAPRSENAHLRAARAFGVSGDVRRACAHWRSLVEIAPSSQAGERAEACWDSLTRGTAPPGSRAASSSPVAFSATVRCEAGGGRCPRVIVITPSGRALSPTAPFGAEPIDGGLALGAAGEGTYRTLLMDGDDDVRGRVRVVAHGKAREIAFTGGSKRTALTTRIALRWPGEVREPNGRRWRPSVRF
jgi:hypothetical protein